MLHIKAELQLCQVLRLLDFHSKILQQYLRFWFCMDSGCDHLRFLSSDQNQRSTQNCKKGKEGRGSFNHRLIQKGCKAKSYVPRLDQLYRNDARQNQMCQDLINSIVLRTQDCCLLLFL